MKALVLTFALLLPTAASALQGPLTTRMTCAEVQATVARRGAIVLNFSPSTYDRVVRDQRWCLPSEGTVNLYVPTRDNPQCFAGYTCREGDTWDRW
jgi:hypothetical protein